MRIMHVISTPASDGPEVHVRDLSCATVEAGHSVHVVFLERAEECGRDPQESRDFLARLSECGVTYAFLGTEARRRPWRAAWRLRQQARQFAPDVVHCHFNYALLLAFGLPRSLPVIMTVHSIELGAPDGLLRLFDRRASAYIGICHAGTRKLSSLTSRPVVQIDNAVSGSRLKASGWREVVEGDPVKLVAIGRLSDDKHYSLMLESCARLKARGLKFTLRIAGDGVQKAALSDLIARLELESHVSLIGNISNVADLLSSADIFIMSSAWEGLPISLLEATLSGLPVLVTNVGGCAEVVHRTGNGLVVDENTPERYAQLLGLLVGDSVLRRSCARNARRHAGSYHIRHATTAHLALYAQYLPVGVETAAHASS